MKPRIADPQPNIMRFLNASFASTKVLWLIFSNANPSYDGPLKGYAGRSGRLDIVVRVFLSAGYPAGDALEGVLLSASLSGVGLLLHKPSGKKVYERDLAGEILEALKRGSYGSTIFIPGLSGFELLTLALQQGFKPVLLLEECTSLHKLELPRGKFLFIVGADIDPPREIEKLEEVVCASIGSKSYLASTVTAYITALLICRDTLQQPLCLQPRGWRI